MNTLGEILSHLLATLRTDLGTFDLSADDRVKVGTFPKPIGTGPFVGVGPAELRESVPYGRGPDWHLESYAMQLRCFAPALRGTTDSIEARGRLLAAEVIAALEEAHRLPGTYPANGLRRCVRFRAASTDANPAGDNALPGHGWVFVNLDFSFRRATATGA